MEMDGRDIFGRTLYGWYRSGWNIYEIIENISRGKVGGYPEGEAGRNDQI